MKVTAYTSNRLKFLREDKQARADGFRSVPVDRRWPLIDDFELLVECKPSFCGRVIYIKAEDKIVSKKREKPTDSNTDRGTDTNTKGGKA